MNQSFKKKVVVASIAAAFVAVGAGVAVVPGLSPVGVVHANQFADTTQIAGVTAGVSVPVSATAVVTGQSFVITENTGGAISTGNIILSLTGGAKWVAVTATPTGAMNLGAGAATAATAAAGQLQIQGADLVVPVTTKSAAGAGQTITISGVTLDTSTLSTGTAVSVSISSSSTSTGVTSGVSTLLATTSGPAVTVTTSATTVPTYPKAGAQSISNTITITESIPGSIKDLSSAVDEVTVTLPSGYTFSTGGAATYSAPITGNAVSVSGNVAKYDVTNTAQSTASKITIGNPTVYIPSSAADGDVKATVAVKLSNGTTSSTDVTLFKVASAGTTAAVYTTGTTTAQTTFDKLYAGRAGQATTADLAVKETVGATLLAGGTVSLTLPTGVKAGKNYTTSDVVATAGVNAVSTVTAADGTTDETGLNSIMATLAGTTDSDNTAGKVTFTLGSLNLTDDAVVGDLNVTVGGNAGVTATTAKVAEVIRATSASASGTIPTVTAGSVLALPDVVITESKAGALTTSATGLGLYIAQANGVNLTTTNATVKAYKADGTDISSTIFGSATGATITAGAAGVMGFPVTTASSSSTGPVTIKISGVSATILSTAAAGDITATVGGMSTLGADTTPTSDEGAKAFKQSVVVGKIVSATVPSATPVTVTGSITSQNISVGIVPAGNDQGKQGSVFVAAIVPASTGIGGTYFMDNKSGWTLFSGCATAPAYSSGSLTGTSGINLLTAAADLTVLKGTKIYVGYGIGGDLAPAGTACNSMLTNGSYTLSYTIN